MKGTIKWVSLQRGYGFIAGEDGFDYFFHAKGTKHPAFSELCSNQKVSFETSVSQKGRQAIEVLAECESVK